MLCSVGCSPACL
jgi:hypothetical protein